MVHLLLVLSVVLSLFTFDLQLLCKKKEVMYSLGDQGAIRVKTKEIGGNVVS